MKTLDYAFSKIDASVIKGQIDLLQSLIDNILTKLEKASLTRSNYETYGAALFVLYQLVTFFQKEAPNVLSTSKCQEIRSCLKKIKEKQEYYPFAYYSKLIKIGINKLTSGSPAYSTIRASHRAFYMTIGTLNFAQAIIAAAHLNLDMGAFENGVQSLQRAFSDLSPDWKNRDLANQLNAIFKSSEMTLKTNEFKHFKECCDRVADKFSMIVFKRSKWKIRRFCLVNQLHYLALSGITDVQKCAIEKLICWGAKSAESNSLFESRHIFLALLESLFDIHKTGEYRCETMNVLKKMTSTTNKKFKTMVNEWCHPKTVEEKLNEASTSTLEQVDLLYWKIRKRLGLTLTHEVVQFNLKDLKETYRSSSFAEVNSIFQDDLKKHVKNFKHEIVRYYHVFLEEGKDQTANDDHFTKNRIRKQRKKESVSLHDLFRPRARGSDPLPRPVKAIHLVGLPGTGKTSLSKVLAYRWAVGEIGQEFKAVYFVPVRNLTKDSAKVTHRDDILITTIGEICFARIRTEDERIHLKMQIEDDLWKPTTLLIIDGLDEGNDNSKAVIRQALQFNCAFFITSRPYYMADVCKKVDIEMECLGLNDNQVLDFIHVFPNLWKARLVEFLLNRQSIWEMAHVPVTLHIICSLWKEKEERGESGPLRIEKESLYSQMIHLIWMRFVEKTESMLDESEVFQTLEKIAFEAQSSRKVLITPLIVNKNMGRSLPPNVFRHSGFLLLQEEGGLYQFPHLSFQENLAGKHLMRLLLTPSDKREATFLISKMKYDEAHSATLSFMAQEACHHNVEALEVIFSVVDEGPRDALGIKHVCLKLRIAEAYFSVNENAQIGTPGFDACLDIVKAGTSLLGKHKSNDAMAEAFLRKLIKLPNVIRIISKYWSSEISRIACAASKMHDSVLLARFLNYSREKLEQFLAKLDTDEPEWPCERRLDVLTHLPLEHIVITNLEHRERLLKFLAKRSVLENERISETSLTLLGRCIESSPDLIFEVEKIMKDCGTDPDDFLVFTRCTTLAKDRRIGSNVSIEYLSRKCKHQNVFIRQSAVENISDFAERWPDAISAVLGLLVHAFGDVDPTVRKHTVTQFEKVVVVFPEEAGVLWSTLTKMIEDIDTNVRAATIALLPNLMNLLPKHKDEAWKMLRTKTRDEDKDIQRLAVAQILNVNGLLPKQEEEAWEIFLSRWQAFDFHVRHTALMEVANFAQRFPNQEKSAWDILMLCHKDHNIDIRKIALEQICELTKKFQERDREAWTILLTQCNDDNEAIRRTIKTQMTELVKYDPERAFTCHDLVSTLCDDPDCDVRKNAASRIPLLAQLFTKNPNLGWDLLLKLCRDQDRNVRETAVSQISEMVILLPNTSEKGWNLLKELCLGQDRDIRRSVAKQIAEMSKQFPQYLEEAQDLPVRLLEDQFTDFQDRAASQRSQTSTWLSKSLSGSQNPFSMIDFDEDRDIQQSARIKPPELSKLLSENPKEKWKCLLKLCDDQKVEVREFTASQLSETARQLPEKGKEAWNVLTKLCNDRNWAVRQSATSQVSELVKLIPEIESEAWKLLLQLCNDDDPDVRQTTAFQISKMPRPFDENCTIAWLILQSLCDDKHWAVRESAVNQISELASAFSDRPNVVWGLLKKLSYDQDSYIRKSVTIEISDTIKLLPEQEKEVWDLLSKLCNDQELDVRVSATSQISKLVTLFPNLKKAWDLLSMLCKNQCIEVRKRAISQIKKMNESFPNDAWDLMSKLTSSQHKDIRETAAIQIPEMAKLLPDTRKECWNLLSKLCSDHSRLVRKSATSQISEVAKLCQGYQNEAWHLLSKSCNDHYCIVRKSAVGQLSSMAKMFPSNGKNIWETYKKCIGDPNDDVKNAALELVLDFVEHFPGMEKEMWGILSKGCRDGYDGIRLTAIRQVGDFVRKVSLSESHAMEILSERFLDANSEIKQLAFAQFAELAKHHSENEREVWRAAILRCEGDNPLVLESSDGRIVGLTEVTPETGEQAWMVLSNRCNDADIRVRCSAVNCIAKFAKKSPGSEIALLKSACNDSADDVRRAALQQLGDFLHHFPANISKTKSLLCSMCKDRTLDIRQKAFLLYVKSWNLDLEDFPGPLHFLKIAEGIGTHSSFFAVLSLCSRLFETRFAEEALKVVTEISTRDPDSFKEKALKTLGKASTKLLLDLFPTLKGKYISRFLAERILLTSTIVFDRTNPYANEFFFFDAEGKKEWEAPFRKAFEAVFAIRETLSREFPYLSDIILKHCAPF